MKPSIAIIGSGAAAAFAHRACKDYGCTKVDVYTDRMGKPSPGAFFFHWLPNDLRLKFEPENVHYMGMGTAERYWLNQWPDIAYEAMGPTSFPVKTYAQSGWDGHTVWDALWDNAKITIMAERFSDSDLREMAKFHDIVLLTFPTQESLKEQGWCQVQIPIESVQTVTMQIPPSSMLTLTQQYDNFILYNGGEMFQWVRMSRLWGRTSFEYAHNSTYGQGDVSMTHHPDLLPSTPVWSKVPAKNFMLVGRFARWDRKYLSHQSYPDTIGALEHWDQGHRDFKELL